MSSRTATNRCCKTELWLRFCKVWKDCGLGLNTCFIKVIVKRNIDCQEETNIKKQSPVSRSLEYVASRRLLKQLMLSFFSGRQSPLIHGVITSADTVIKQTGRQPDMTNPHQVLLLCRRDVEIIRKLQKASSSFTGTQIFTLLFATHPAERKKNLYNLTKYSQLKLHFLAFPRAFDSFRQRRLFAHTLCPDGNWEMLFKALGEASKWIWMRVKIILSNYYVSWKKQM